MSTTRRKRVVYVTSSQYKRDENAVFARTMRLANGTLVGDAFEFEIQRVRVQEILNVDIELMVREEVKSAYRQVRVPCIVEHAGLIFLDYPDKSYPGGLTKPMWDALGDRFLVETGSAGHRALARAVVAYTDGMTVKTFVGEKSGVLAESPRGSRTFYWDTIFAPDDPEGKTKGKTYAEIFDDPLLGLEYKLKLSQSSAAMLSFLEYRLTHPPSLWCDDA